MTKANGLNGRADLPLAPMEASTPEQKCAALAEKLRADRTFYALVEKAGALSYLKSKGVSEDQVFDNICGDLGSYPLKLAYLQDPYLVGQRNGVFLKAISRFQAAFDKFQREAKCRLPTLNDALLAAAGPQKRFEFREYHQYDVRYIPNVLLVDYLDRLSASVESGEYGSVLWQDDLAVTTRGRKPSPSKRNGGGGTAERSTASWMAINVLESNGASAETKEFHQAAGHAVGVMTGEPDYSDSKNIKDMLKQRSSY